MKSGYQDHFNKLKKNRKPARAQKTEEMPIKVRRKAEFPIKSLIMLAMLVVLLGWWSADPELPDRILSKIEFQMMGQASAESTPAMKPEAAKSAETNPKPSAAVAPPATPAVAEDISYFDKLKERKAELDLREKELNLLEEELQKQKVEIEARIRQLEDLRGQIANVLKERIEVDQEKVMKLVETYSNMKPKQAAEILAGIDEDLAVEVLGKMKKKNAAEIMNLLEPAKARSISEKFAGYKIR